MKKAARLSPSLLPARLPSRASGRSHRTPPIVPPLAEQLEAIFKRLKQRYPELLGIGLGIRRRRGRLVSEMTVKLQVRKKHPKSTKGVRFLPARVQLETLALGQAVKVWVPTDIEVPRRWARTQFPVGEMTASTLAAWRKGGKDVYGVVTAGHSLDEPAVSVPMRDATQIQGSVVARSAMAVDGLDVGLVQLPVSDPLLLGDVGSESPPMATADELLLALSSSNTDAIGADGESWAPMGPRPLQAVAFYVRWGWAGVGELRNVVECHAEVDGVFDPGTSGSAWVIVPSGGLPRKIMAIQSHGFKPLFRVAEGTHFLSAVEWLRGRDGLSALERNYGDVSLTSHAARGSANSRSSSRFRSASKSYRLNRHSNGCAIAS